MWSGKSGKPLVARVRLDDQRVVVARKLTVMHEINPMLLADRRLRRWVEEAVGAISSS
jgi:hypothetical protein